MACQKIGWLVVLTFGVLLVADTAFCMDYGGGAADVTEPENEDVEAPFEEIPAEVGSGCHVATLQEAFEIITQVRWPADKLAEIESLSTGLPSSPLPTKLNTRKGVCDFAMAYHHKSQFNKFLKIVATALPGEDYDPASAYYFKDLREDLSNDSMVPDGPAFNFIAVLDNMVRYADGLMPGCSAKYKAASVDWMKRLRTRMKNIFDKHWIKPKKGSSKSVFLQPDDDSFLQLIEETYGPLNCANDGWLAEDKNNFGNGRRDHIAKLMQNYVRTGFDITKDQFYCSSSTIEKFGSSLKASTANANTFHRSCVGLIERYCFADEYFAVSAGPMCESIRSQLPYAEHGHATFDAALITGLKASGVPMRQ